MGELVERKQIVKNGTHGLAGIGGGIALLILNAVSAGAFSIGGLIIGSLLTLFGLNLSRSPKDKFTGLVGTAAGIVTIVASLPIPILTGLSQFLLWGGGIGLLIFGGINLYKMFKGMQSRS